MEAESADLLPQSDDLDLTDDATTDLDLDDESSDDALDPSSPDEESDAPDDDDDDSDDDDEAANLQQRLARLEELEAQVRRSENERKQREAEAYWGNLESQAERYFLAEREKIWAESENYASPTAYIRERMGSINAQEKGWYKQFHASQTESLNNFYERASIPHYAARVAAHYGLPADAAQELSQYPIELMEREAQKIKRNRDQVAALKRQVTQSKRSDAARKKASNDPAAGSGRASSKGVKAGSRAHLSMLLGG